MSAKTSPITSGNLRYWGRILVISHSILSGGHTVWRTTVSGQPDAPPFGHASAAYAVIDTRQSYLQNIVKAAFQALGYLQCAAHLHHFAYEVVRPHRPLRRGDGDHPE